eukprot:m51a1_g9874 hypothetical protein (205) ;mRNA; f:101011-114013
MDDQHALMLSAVQKILVWGNPNYMGPIAASFQLGLPVFPLADLEGSMWALVNATVQRRAQVLVISGLPAKPRDSLTALRKALPRETEIVVVYHASFSMHTHTTEGKMVYEVLELAEQGVVDRVAFLKESIGQWFNLHWRVRPGEKDPVIYGVSNPKVASVMHMGKYSLHDGKTHVGVFVKNSLIKNPITQIAEEIERQKGIDMA